MRTKKEIVDYVCEAFDKVWYMRSHPCDNYEIEKNRLEQIKRIEEKYPDVKKYGDYEYVFYEGVLGSLRWVLGEEEKDFLDT